MSDISGKQLELLKAKARAFDDVLRVLSDCNSLQNLTPEMFFSVKDALRVVQWMENEYNQAYQREIDKLPF